MEGDVRQRVRQILFYKNESVNSFCLKTTDNKKDYQAKQKRYNSQINGSASLSVSTISDILCTFNDISVCWLINGVGEMTNTAGSNPESNIIDSMNTDFMSVFNYFQNEINLKNNEIDSLRKKVKELEDSISRVRDLFVFQCYTGMSYSDLIKFNWNECFIDDGDYYIRDIRFKTGVEYFLMILPPAMDIIKKYNNKLPVISNQQYNLRLKVVGQMCGIEKSLTTHVARHTFATTITLSNGVPISIVSKMLGHTKIATTEQYAKILNKNVKDQFLLLKEKIKRGK